MIPIFGFRGNVAPLLHVFKRFSPPHLFLLYLTGSWFPRCFVVYKFRDNLIGCMDVSVFSVSWSSGAARLILLDTFYTNLVLRNTTPFWIKLYNFLLLYNFDCSILKWTAQFTPLPNTQESIKSILIFEVNSIPIDILWASSIGHHLPASMRWKWSNFLRSLLASIANSIRIVLLMVHGVWKYVVISTVRL